MFIIHKNLSETPLECLERTRALQDIAANVPMTYAGRLDPMASGKLLILVGEECKDKEKYLGLDKEYEIEVLFGVTTDTGDMLGLINEVRPSLNTRSDLVDKFIGKFTQVYPAYSSKTALSRQASSKDSSTTSLEVANCPTKCRRKMSRFIQSRNWGELKSAAQRSLQKPSRIFQK